MRRALKWVTLAGLALLLALQLVPAERTNPPVGAEIAAPEDVRAVLERSCFDCHSNKTRWPWYSRVAPVSWYVIRHVERGRADLNLTEWPLFDPQAQQFFFGEMKGKVKNREMPLPSYLWLHWNARLSDTERLRLISWFDEEARLLSGL